MLRRRLWRISWVHLGAWIAAVLVLLAGCQPPGYIDENELPAEPTPLEVAEPLDLAHDFALPTLDGVTVRLSDLRRRWVLVNFWATWCAPCREEMPYLDRLATDHADRLSVLAINLRESETTVRAFAEELDLRLPILLQPDDATLLAYYGRGLPISVVIDPAGNVVQRVVGPLQPETVAQVMSH
ncbi:MAG TPA: alkyl hydroperoxide reductase [Chloroflexi bacterium]|nr:alkyl hydroperoxide reductase [Chloroflexota bacterium]HHW86672.1 TlpA family protein disulfide reductase [Chloroflexota bacterium]